MLEALDVDLQEVDAVQKVAHGNRRDRYGVRSRTVADRGPRDVGTRLGCVRVQIGEHQLDCGRPVVADHCRFDDFHVVERVQRQVAAQRIDVYGKWVDCHVRDVARRGRALHRVVPDVGAELEDALRLRAGLSPPLRLAGLVAALPQPVDELHDLRVDVGELEIGGVGETERVDPGDGAQSDHRQRGTEQSAANGALGRTGVRVA